MWSRRELMMNGVVGSVSFAPGAPALAQSASQDREREREKEIVSELRAMNVVLTTMADGAELPNVVVAKIRDQMTMFLRANGRFPEFCDVGIGVFYQVYDWHVKNVQPLTLGRQPDGRYAMQFMFTRLVVRPEADVGYVGVPYDNR